MRCKKGQFYLIAAILIIIVLITFATVLNYSRKKNSVKLYDLGEELGIESQNVIDYGTTNGQDMNILLGDFIEDYVEYAGEGKNLSFIFGDKNNLQVRVCDGTNSCTADLILDETESGVVAVTIDEVEYQFALDGEEGQNYFYFVVSQEIEGEKHVITG